MSIEPGTDASRESVTFAGVHATLEFVRPHAGVVLMKFTGYDIGEFGTGPFDELERDLRNGVPIEIFLDAREVRSASIEVSSAWAHWMIARRSLIYRFNMLCRSSFVQMTAGFVQRFTQFAEQMRIYHDAEAFELALSVACGARIESRGTVTSRSLL
jgi:hypothetical protein